VLHLLIPLLQPEPQNGFPREIQLVSVFVFPLSIICLVTLSKTFVDWDLRFALLSMLELA
jgi:hypothetical protein